jgi:HK97 family phage major capsid protein
MPDISRADALALINQQNANEVWQAAAEQSAALRTFRRVNMGTKQVRYPVIAALPEASFVAGEDADAADAVKPTTSQVWGDRVLEAEEVGGIVVIPENVIDDASNDFDLWGEIRPRIAEAIGATLDAAVFFGTNAPATWPVGIVPAAVAAGNTYAVGTSTVDLAEDLNQTIGLVEADGYDPTAVYAARTIRMALRGLRDDNSQPIFTTSLATDGKMVPQVYGIDLEYVTNGAWDAAAASAVVGDPRYAILGIRQDITYKFLDQAAVTIGGVLISLAERDLVGLRFKMRVGFQTAQTPTLDGGATAYPFAVLTPV